MGRKLILLSVGKDAADAGARRLAKEAELRDGENGSSVPFSHNGHKSVAPAVAEYLNEIRLSKKPKTFQSQPL
jgi:hypothetical protein